MVSRERLALRPPRASRSSARRLADDRAPTSSACTRCASAKRDRCASDSCGVLVCTRMLLSAIFGATCTVSITGLSLRAMRDAVVDARSPSVLLEIGAAR